MNSRALHFLGKSSTTELNPQLPSPDLKVNLIPKIPSQQHLEQCLTKLAPRPSQANTKLTITVDTDFGLREDAGARPRSTKPGAHSIFRSLADGKPGQVYVGL